MTEGVIKPICEVIIAEKKKKYTKNGAKFSCTYNTGYVQIKGNLKADGTYDKLLTIPSGVTLLLPYGNTSSDKNSSGEATLITSSSYQENSTTVLSNRNPDNYRKTLVILDAGVALTVNGTLEISGEISGGGGGYMSGHTGGKYASLTMSNGSSIYINGTAKVYGFIEKVSGESNCNVVVNGSIYQPMALLDFKGGSTMKAIKDSMATYGFAPFQQFCFPNVSAKVRINYSGKLYGWGNLYAGSQQNFTTATIVSNGSGALIQFTDSTFSYLTSEYNPSTQITDLKIYGGAKMNSMSLTVKAFGQTETVNSSDFVFAFSWLYNITLDNNTEDAKNIQSSASYLMPHKYKMLPGSKFIVEAGATLTLENTLSIYTADAYNDTFASDLGAPGLYPEVYPFTSLYAGTELADAMFVVRGKLVANNLGGNVYSDVIGASIIVTGKTVITTFEQTAMRVIYIDVAGTTQAFGGEIVGSQKVTSVLKLIYMSEVDESTIYNEQKAVFPNATFETKTLNDVTNWYTDVEIAWITIEIPTSGLPEGVYITVDSTVLVEDGVFVGMGDAFDSRYNKSSSINVIPGSLITYHLQANHLATTETGTTVKVNAGDIKNANYEYLVEATENALLPNIYVVPVLTLKGYDKLNKCNVTYKNLGSDAYIEIYMEKSASGLGPSVSFTVTATKSSTTGTGTKNGSGLFTAKASTTVKVYENESVTVS